jgi:dipeptidyl aminopeptidase/acylaminoacyl peptidase
MNRCVIQVLALMMAMVLVGCHSPSKMNFGKGLSMKNVPIIPRTTLFGNPDRAAVRVSPDGKFLSYLAPKEGVLNVWVAPIDSPDKGRAVTDDKGRGIRNYFWAFDNAHLVYTQDQEGDENWRVYSVEVKSSIVKDLTPLEGVRAEIQEVSRDYPKDILVALNDRDERYHDLYKINIETGERSLLVENEEEFAGFVTDGQFQVRFASKMQPDSSNQYFQRTDSGWVEFLSIPGDDALNTYIEGFDKTGRKVYLVDSRDRNTSALTILNLDAGRHKLVAEDPRADLDGVMKHPTEKHIQAVSFNYDRRRFVILDESIRGDIEALEKVSRGELQVVDRTDDDSLWVVAYLRDDGPLEYYLWDRKDQKERYLFNNRKDLEGLLLSQMDSVIIPARDGFSLVSYLTLPPWIETDDDGRPVTPLPMVLLVHGGPWARDSWGYDAEHQWLANRGYAVLSVNFRGSTGLGKDFVNAADKEWGAKMHDDLLDAVQWAVKEGIAQKEKVAIMGGSYGGYATLAGLTMTPDVFAAGVDIVGPSSLITLLESIPPYWVSAAELFRRRVGDLSTKEGREFLESRSPLSFVDQIERPLLIGQGANDPRVKQAEADQIVEAMTSRHIPVTYVLYPDEGHGFARPENRISFQAVTEAFLSQHLGGRYEPIGDAFQGSSLLVPAGQKEVPGLEQAVQTK